MFPVLKLQKYLFSRPESTLTSGISLRTYKDRADITAWIYIQEAATRANNMAKRPRTSEDFEREFLDKPWWSPERMLFAESATLESPASVVGTVALAGPYPGQNGEFYTVNWLAVLPEFQKRGIGAGLLAAIEQVAWEVGGRELRLETLDSWTAEPRRCCCCATQ